MERVTFQEPNLERKLARSCVRATRDLDPSYRGPAPEAAAPVARALEAGDASGNVATFFSLASGELLHLVPGYATPARLERELDFALAVRESIRGKSRLEALRLVARAHRERAKTLDSRERSLVRVHDLLSRRPLVPASKIGPKDYADEATGAGKAVIAFEPEER